MSEKHFSVELKRSGIGRNEKQKRTLIGLGLKRFGHKVFLKDTPAIRGMLYKVAHLVEVEAIEGAAPASRRQQAKQA